tara:strand:+ start:358 stop:816 length:459 start_codon:yes stop_codon:yes gene_type:complete
MLIMLTLKLVKKNKQLILAVAVIVCLYLLNTRKIEFFSKDQPKRKKITQEVAKVPFFKRLALSEDMNDPKIRRIVTKAAYMAAKDNLEIMENIKKTLGEYVTHAIDIDSSMSRLDTNVKRMAKEAASKGANRAVLEAEMINKNSRESVTPSP